MCCCPLDGGSAGTTQRDGGAQGRSGTVGKLGTMASLQPLSESGRHAMLTPHIVCQTPKGGADFSRSSFPILCVSDLSLSTCYKVAEKPVQVRQRGYM